MASSKRLQSSSIIPNTTTPDCHSTTRHPKLTDAQAECIGSCTKELDETLSGFDLPLDGEDEPPAVAKCRLAALDKLMHNRLFKISDPTQSEHLKATVGRHLKAYCDLKVNLLRMDARIKDIGRRRTELHRMAAILGFERDPARQLFAIDNEVRILEEIDNLKVKYSDFSESSLREEAITRLWSQADQGLWDDRVRAVVNDVEKNRESLESVMRGALKNITHRGSCGTMIASVHCAFRDQKTLVTKFADAGYDASKQSPLSWDSKQQHATRKEFAQFAKILPDTNVVPSSQPTPGSFDPAGMSYKKTDDGRLIFPDQWVDLTEKDLRACIKAYLSAIWALEKGVSPKDTPWAEWAQATRPPFDTRVFKFPLPLKSPKEYTYPELQTLAKFFATCSAGQSPGPFSFTKTLSFNKKSSAVPRTTTPAPHPAPSAPLLKPIAPIVRPLSRLRLSSSNPSGESSPAGLPSHLVHAYPSPISSRAGSTTPAFPNSIEPHSRSGTPAQGLDGMRNFQQVPGTSALRYSRDSPKRKAVDDEDANRRVRSRYD